MSYFLKRLNNSIGIYITWQSRKPYLLFFLSYIEILVLKFSKELNFLRLRNIFSIYIISDCNTIHWYITNCVAYIINSHNLLDFFIDFKLAQVSENVRVAVWCKVRKKYNVIVILKLIRKRKSICFLKLVFHTFNISWIKAHIQSFTTCSNSQVIIIIFNVETFSVPLHSVALQVSFQGIDEWLHSH